MNIERGISAPAKRVAAFVSDFRNSREWMVGIEKIEQTSEDGYRLTLDTPIGNLRPEARVVEHRPDFVRWVYTSTVEGEGQVNVEDSPDGDARSCVVRYRGNFRVKGRILGRAAKAMGMEGFARRQGERSLQRLKNLMEAGRR